ncbi:MAG: hypothetical protein LUD02_06065 [Tannerellaceae bacterium]|nr:hypothetical protein [Tannerellaceae bacterium]MCD8263766.1 hypothetical protein [Tannerellaceae bacterium]
MNIEEVREYCLTLRNTTESQPFGEEHVVFKVEEKMFLPLTLATYPPVLQ